MFWSENVSSLVSLAGLEFCAPGTVQATEPSNSDVDGHNQTGGSKRRSSQPVAEYDSDDERRYSRDPVPDPNSQEYYHDDVDQFHQNRDKILIDKGIKREQADLSSDDQEEVYGLGLESDDDDAEIAGYQRTLRGLRHVTSRKDELGSDVEDGGQDYDDRVWGNEKSKYYGADVEDDDIDISDSEGEAAAAVLEEKEALALQRKMAEQLEEQDFGLENFTMEKSQSSMTDGERIVKDLSKVSKREKLELLNEQSPELLELIDDYVVKMSTVKDVLQPLRRLIQNGQLPSGKAADYVDSKFSLYLNYCVNITFYMMLKAKCTPVENHPVIKRLLQYRNLIKQLEPLDKLLKPEIDAILERVKRGEELKICGQTTTSHRLKPNIQLMKAALDSTKRRKLSEALEDSGDEEPEITKAGSKKRRSKVAESYMTKGESEALEFYQMMKGGRKSVEQGDDGNMDVGEEGIELESGEIIGEEELDDTDGKRAITYQIAKNKGLTPHRKKEQRNPRVKHRMKYRKAKIRRKGMIREPRKELNPYGGELSGIRAGVKRSVKLK